MASLEDRWIEVEQALSKGLPLGPEDPFEGLDDSERIELAERLERFADGWLSSREGRNGDFEPVATGDPQLERVRRSVNGESGMWPSMLPRLRERVGLGRDELAERLAADLGQSQNSDKVRRYYHGMEWGRLPGSGVSDAVLDSLARLLDTDPQDLRESGSGPGRRSARRSGRTAQAFARFVGDDVSAAATRPVDDFPSEDDWDEADRLFLGG